MTDFRPIAIVGQACLLPGAHSPEELWAGVAAGRDLLSHASAETWQVAHKQRLMRTDAEAPPAERIATDRGGYVSGFANIFDAGAHRLDRALVASLDPHFQWLLHVGAAAMRDAGLSVHEPARSGAIVGNLSYPTYGLNNYAAGVWAAQLLAQRGAALPANPQHLNRFMSGLPVQLLCESLQLASGGFMVDAACASGLYAIKFACDWLAAGQADVMLAGGVARVHGLTIHAGFTTLQALSSSGQSRPLHAAADGLVPAEGAALVVLKRLEDALADGSRILGVIRGVGLANDGRGAGMLVPSAAGQVRAMQAAFRGSGLRPQDIDLIECHATGTMLGDATEIQSCAEVFSAAKTVALGSVKGNLGHLLPVAGVAGLIKVLQSMQAGVQPAIPQLDVLNPALHGTVLAPGVETQDWKTRSVRRAAINAFGFGGNNAQLLVEQSPTVERPKRGRGAALPRAERCAIVAVAVRMGDGADVQDFWRALVAAPGTQAASAAGAMRTIRLPMQGSAFPPKDLEHAAAQQLLALELAHQALAQVPAMPFDNTAVFVGMGCDAEACRFGLNLRLGEFLDELQLAAPAGARFEKARQQLQPGPVAASTLGLMPNVIANRLNRQFGCGGASCAVSAEQLSGLHALQLALQALQSGAADAALVGAVDVGAEPVHRAALAGAGQHLGGVVSDGGCMLVLKREADAVRAGDTIYALIDGAVAAGAAEWSAGSALLAERCGYCHAAQALLQVAAAALALKAGAVLPAAQRASAANGAQKGRALRVAATGLRGESGEIYLRACDAQPHWNVTQAAKPAANGAGKALLTFAAHRQPVAEILEELLGAEPAAGATVAAGAVAVMPLAPRLQAVHSTRAELFAAAKFSAPAIASTQLPASALAPMLAAAHAVQPAADWVEDAARMHALFLEEMANAHAVFLRSMGGSDVLAIAEPVATQAARGGAYAPQPAAQPPGAAAGSSPPQPPEFVQAAAQRGAHAANGKAAAPPPPVVAAAAAQLPGPKFSRAQLEQLASGNISELFGPAFAGQDGFERQVRMPMPPMLLADRVTGIDAVPGELGTGSIWTETDVQPDAWYLHDGHVPLGITIESGQADLLLVSWMGIDALNRSDRVYRLLGCEAEIKGPLPKGGDTLQFDIHIDGHAQLGDIRMFFFRSDLRVNGEVRLSVRHGQAGFFTDAELAASDGVIWNAATEAAPALRKPGQPLQPALTTRRAFSAAQVRAFSEGRAAECFGAGFELTETHSRTPRIQPGNMCFLDEVTEFEPQGGPWGRGYLRAVKAITPDLWFFGGHFKNDPCMPGTLMLEGAVQALAFYVAALGATVRRDGWRFEAGKNENVTMWCRGQCVPTSRELVYEVYVEEFEDGAFPLLRASVMASVDGHKAFLCQQLSVELVQDWPLADMLQRGALLATQRGQCFTLAGFEFNHRSLLACALGQPSAAFGPALAIADRPLRLPRLPCPPYHFMTRIVECAAQLGRPAAGSWMESEFDFAAGDWYFERSANATLPACVFMEALLQPCGWLSSFMRDASAQTGDIFFRNLDGSQTWTDEVLPQTGTLRVRTELTSWSELGPMIITVFRVEARLSGKVIATMETSFGFFPGDAFENQAGLVPAAAEAEYFALAAAQSWQLRGSAAQALGAAGAALAGEPLLMLDRVTGWWPEAGAAQLGMLRAEKDVRAADWFFKAHFMQDPVQPGSLGIEALLQALQCAMRLRGVGAQWGAGARFEPVALGVPLTWKYRGQVVPANQLITTLVELVRIDEDPADAITVHARGSLWVDGKKIYDAPALAMRVRAAGAAPAGSGSVEKEFSLNLTPWLHDHRPSFTAAVIPLTVMLDELAAAGAAGAGGAKLVELGAFVPARWLACAQAETLKLRLTAAQGSAGTTTTAQLAVWRAAKRAQLSRYDEVGATTLKWAAQYGTPPAALAALAAPLVPSPYESGETTHGPAFQVLRELRRSAAGASALLDAGAGSVPVGFIHPALLDGCTHAVPLSRLAEWFPLVGARWNGLPRGVQRVQFYGPTPVQGVVRCEIRPQAQAHGSAPPVIYVQFVVGAAVWCDLTLEFTLLDALPFAGAPFAARRAFVRREAYAPMRFSSTDGSQSTGSEEEMARYQWMPGQLETIFGLPAPLALPELTAAITAKEHVAHALRVHPAAVALNAAHTQATSAHFPLQAWPVSVRNTGGQVQVQAAGDAQWLPTSGANFFHGEFLDDLSLALRSNYVRHFRLAEPALLAALHGRPFVICSNHQTAVESMLLTDMFVRWSGLPMTTVTRTEHAASWMGRLTDFLWRQPGRSVAVNPQLLFARERPEAFLDLMAAYSAAQAATPHSLHLHVEGEQATSSRQRVQRMSAVVIDLALELQLPILPLRFSGGLPLQPLAEICSFPIDFGRQDYTVGRPLLPEELRSMPRPKAAELVVAAINAIDVEEQPLPGVPGRSAALAAFCAQHGATEIQAAVILALRTLAAPSASTRSILDFPAHGSAGVVAAPAELAWHREVAQWLWGADERSQREADEWKRTARM